MSKEKKTIFMPLLVILAAGLLTYANSFDNSFQFDDEAYIVENPLIKNITRFDQIAKTLPHYTRIIPVYSFALNYHFHGLNVFGYHLVNFFIHLLNTLCVWWFVRLIFQTPKFKKDALAQKADAIALAAALLFIAHPLGVSAVTYITQRFASMAAFFYLLSLCLYIKGRISEKESEVYFTGSVLAGVCALFSKENAATLPLMVGLCEVFFFERKPRENRLITLVILFFAVAALFVTASFFQFNLFQVFTHEMDSWSHQGDKIGTWTYLLTQFRVMATYIRLWVFPLNQTLDYDFPASHHLFDGSTFICFLFLAGLIIFASRIRSKQPLVSFGLFWFFIALLVESSVIAIRHSIFEFRAYLPSVGFCILAGTSLCIFSRSQKQFWGILSAVVIILIALTYRQNIIWQSPMSLWSEALRHAPNKARPHIYVANEYRKEGEYAKALAHFDRALELKPWSAAEVYNNRGLIYMNQNKMDLAIADFTEALTINPKHYSSLNNRGQVYFLMREYAKALSDFNEALEMYPAYVKALVSRASVHGRMGKVELALNDFNQALLIDPRSVETYVNRGNMYGRMKEYELAIADFNKAVDLAPRLASIYKNRGNAYELSGNHKLALKDYNQALALNPNYADVYFNRAVLQIILGNRRGALSDLDYLLAMDPDYPQARKYKAMLLADE